MPVKYIPYKIEPLRGQAVLPFLRYHRRLSAQDFQLQGMPYFEVALTEQVNQTGKKPNKNLLIHGDCLNACAHLKEQGITVDLVYIDPPFASGANYAKKIFIRQNPKLVAKLEKAQEQLQSQAGAEVDNKHLQTLEETMYGDIWKKEDYLNWLYERLLAIKEVMSDTASIYVHLDWHIGHYVKVLMDEVFGEENFLNDIIWGYKTGGIPETGKFAKKHDLIFLYKKGEQNIFNDLYQKSYVATVPEPHTNSGKRLGVKRDETCDICGNGPGQKYREVQMRDVWDDISSIYRNDDQVQDYATQKPEALLERIIQASTNAGMVVADFFGGSGVTAKVAHSLDRTFITADVGINAIQTMRDRLVEAGARFDMLKIKDGIDLFRNPQQTMDKLASIIPGLSTHHSFGSFWFGAILDKGTVCPCWIPNLKDKQQAILNPALFSKIMDETVKLDGIGKVIVCSVDITGEDAIKKMIRDYDLRDTEGKPVQFIFKDLKELIDLIVSPDLVEYTILEKEAQYHITFDRYISDALIQKIAEFNAKKTANQNLVEISDEGLELIEFVSVDCTNATGVWVSDHEVKINKNGYQIVNGEQSKQFWDGTVTVRKKPLRIKVRSIAGDEVEVMIDLVTK